MLGILTLEGTGVEKVLFRSQQPICLQNNRSLKGSPTLLQNAAAAAKLFEKASADNDHVATYVIFDSRQT